MSHPGTVKMKPSAQSYCYLSNIDTNIEQFVNICGACKINKKEALKINRKPWDEPWQRIM